MKRYLVTGCYGFLGSHVSQALLAAGHEVIGVDRLKGAQSKKGARVQALAKAKRFKFREADLSEFSAVKRLFHFNKPDEVVHFAAQYAVMHSAEHVQSYARNNCDALLWLFEHAREAGHKRFTYASSTFVEEGVMSTHLYGATKHFAEHVASTYTAVAGMTTVGIRYGSTFGPMCRPDVGIYQLAKKLLNGTQIKVSPAFHYATAFCDVRDAVAATLALLKAPLPTGAHTATVIAPDRHYDLGDILRVLEEATGKTAAFDWHDYNVACDWPWRDYNVSGVRPYDARHNEKLHELCGYYTQHSVVSAVWHFAEWAVQAHKAGEL